ncbi:phage integrase SAM-like domain-containing protein [Flavobacterium sp. ZS1P14]|uniref:phage integrase SAM-like domain-containing protein n=1 Tax=Flavobacterium sp. ZS1P14 TaxID=3401729 RepID=UPI003AAE0359
MKQATHFFNLEAKPTNSGEHLIFFNFSYGFKEYNLKTKKHIYLPVRLSTEYRIQKEYWNDQPIYRPNQTYIKKFGKNLNNVLDKIETTSYGQLNLFRDQHDKDPTPNELKTLILEKLGRTIKLNNDIRIIDYIAETVTRRTATEITSSQRWSAATGNQYTNLKNHIENYETNKKTILTFSKLTGEIFLDFFKEINDIHKKANDEYYAHNTIVKENKHFRAILNAALKNNISIGFNHTSEEYEIKRREIKNEIILTIEQLTTIINSDVNYSKEFIHARNYIIISSFTGLRISDMVYLNEIEPKDIKHNSKNYYCIITKIRKSKENKDELTATIPILSPIKTYLQQNNNKFPKFPAQTNIRKYITKYLKHLEIDNLVDVKKYYYTIDNPVITKEKLSDIFNPHDCRSTFITNLKELGILDEDIEPITHPKHKYKSIVQTYDKTKLISKAVNLINILNSKKSPLYKY